MTTFGIFQVPRLVEELERSLERGVTLRIVLGDRESHSDQETDASAISWGGYGERETPEKITFRRDSGAPEPRE
jgi:hypothetical protein